MAEQDPLDPVLSTLANIMAFLRDNASSPQSELPPDIEKRLQNLELAVKSFKEATDRGLEQEGFNLIATRKKVMRERDHFPARQKKRIEQTLEMGKELIALKIGHDKALKKIQAPDTSVQKAPKPTKQKIVKRKSKFKKVGGDKNWNRI